MFMPYVCLILYIFLYFLVSGNVEMRYNILYGNSYILWFVKSTCGIIVMIEVFKFLPNMNVLSYIGKNSISYDVLHWIILVLIRNLLLVFYPNYTNSIFITIALLSFITIMPICEYLLKKHFPLIIGK